MGLLHLINDVIFPVEKLSEESWASDKMSREAREASSTSNTETVKLQEKGLNNQKYNCDV